MSTVFPPQEPLTAPLAVDQVCPGCGCLCDDLRLTPGGGDALVVESACPRGAALFEIAARPVATAFIGDHEVEWEEGLAAAGNLLVASRAPLIFGLHESCVETVRAAIALAERLRGVIDPATTRRDRAVLSAIQQRGWPTATLGELRDRADCVIFWRADPTVTHPRFLERFVPPNPNRRVVWIGGDRPENRGTDEVAIPVPNGDDWRLVRDLRTWLRNGKPPAGSIGDGGDDRLRLLTETIAAARYGVVCLGELNAGLARSQLFVEELISLVAELNARARWSVLSLGGLKTAEQVLAWQTGYACSVSFADGVPAYDPSRSSAESLLVRGAVDAVVQIGDCDPAEFLGDTAARRLQTLPTIRIRHTEEEPQPQSNSSHVTFLCPPDAWTGGTFFRLDGVPLRGRPLVPPSSPYAAQLLRKLTDRATA